LWNQRLLTAEQAPLLLSPLQERAVWKRVIPAEAGAAESIAKLAAEAWKLLSAYNEHDQRHHAWSVGTTGGDAEAFRGWALAFDRECRKQHWTSRSDLAALLAESQLPFPPEILLVGFDRITPAQRSLLEAARSQGATVSEWQTPPPPSLPQAIVAKDLRDELAACAAWLRRQLEANPGARLAVIVQDIDANRGEIDRAFRRVLAPQSGDFLPWEFSLGQPLAAVPVVKAALLLLRWLVEPLAQAEISWLLLSGFLSPNPDIAEMAALDAEMRKESKLPPEASLEAVAGDSTRMEAPAARAWVAMLRDLQRLSVADNLAQRIASIPDWLDLAERLWKQAHWPGARALESVEFQALRRWDQLLADIAALGFDGSRVSFAEFAAFINTYSKETIFAPESRDAPIQIMGAFESAGQRFDAVWLLGADDQQWPPTGQAHPLLPAWLQRKAAMPHATLDADWQLARAITQRIAASAPLRVFSHAERDDSGELRISPLLREPFAKPIASEEFRQRLNLPQTPQPALETVPYEDSPPIPWPREIVAGGAEILKAQSACPFQSFAVRRLGARELDSAERGLTPIERGNILHDALKSLWSATPGRENALHSRADLLRAQADGSLSRLLDRHIANAFRERQPSSNQSEWTRHYLGIEQQRLKKLLLQWLDYEAKRTDFAVAEREEQRETVLDGLILNLRVDRIDRIEGGSLIVDYKTGDVSPKLWNCPRPDDPQLPLYRIHRAPDDVKGVLFAQISAGDACFKGRIEHDTVAVTNDEKENNRLAKWALDETTLGEWSDELSKLADGFLLGDAAVDPKSHKKTCQYCELSSLCRVAETTAALEGSLDAEDAADNVESEAPSHE
jgi:probable DNA repair protein